ncbi:MAG: hypothetical protein HGA97_07535 [Chlorobiaceae bacterium]|nr:hypothetical protein [Chlorobiaceae bacterium]
MSKHKVALFIVFLMFFFMVHIPRKAYAYRAPKTPLRCGYGIISGFKTVNLGREVIFSHDTYYADNFLPNYNVPGSAGTTSVGPDLEFAFYGFGFHRPLSEHVLLNAGFGVMKDFGTNRDRHRNDNDPRVFPYACFVYSDSNVGGFSSMGLSYYMKRFYVGADVEFDVIKITHALDRFDRDHTQKDDILKNISGGPKIGYYVFNNLSLEGSALLGKYPSYNVVMHWWFFK